MRRQIGGSDAIPKDHGLWSQIQVLVRFVCDLQRFGLRFSCLFFSGTNIKLHPQACTGALSRSAGSQENIVLVTSEDSLCFLSSHAPSMESEGTAPLRPACRHLPQTEDRRLFTAKGFTITRSQVQRSQIISIDTTRFGDARRPLKAIWRFSLVCFAKLAIWRFGRAFGRQPRLFSAIPHSRFEPAFRTRDLRCVAKPC